MVKIDYYNLLNTKLKDSIQRYPLIIESYTCILKVFAGIIWLPINFLFLSEYFNTKMIKRCYSASFNININYQSNEYWLSNSK